MFFFWRADLVKSSASVSSTPSEIEADSSNVRKHSTGLPEVKRDVITSSSSQPPVTSAPAAREVQPAAAVDSPAAPAFVQTAVPVLTPAETQYRRTTFAQSMTVNSKTLLPHSYPPPCHLKPPAYNINGSSTPTAVTVPITMTS